MRDNNNSEQYIALAAISHLRSHGLTIGKGWEVNGEPSVDVGMYLDSIIETCCPTDEDELAKQVIELIEYELQQSG